MSPSGGARPREVGVKARAGVLLAGALFTWHALPLLTYLFLVIPELNSDEYHLFEATPRALFTHSAYLIFALVQLVNMASHHPTIFGRRATTTVTLPPSDSAIFVRGIAASLLSGLIFVNSGIDIPDLNTLRHPSESWLIQYTTDCLCAAVKAIDPTVDFDHQSYTRTSLKFHWLLRFLVICFVWAACYAQFDLATKRRAVPIKVGWNGGPSFIVGHWRPDFFWPLFIMEVGLLMMPRLYQERMGFLNPLFFIATCTSSIFLGLTTTTNFGDGVWDGDETGEYWELNLLKLVLKTVFYRLTWQTYPKVKDKQARPTWQ